VSGYARGRVIVNNNSVTVTALWELLVTPSAYAHDVLHGVYFGTSGAQCIVRAHDRVSGRLVVEPVGGSPDPGGGAAVDGSPIFPGEPIYGPTASLVESNTATSATNTTLTRTGAGWLPDQHAGSWLGIRIGLGDGQEEWRLIDSNTDSVLTVLPPFTVNPVFTHPPSGAVPYQIREGTAGLGLSGFLAGTPQDWTIVPVVAGHRFYADGQDRYAEILSAAAKTITLVSPWTGLTDKNAGYAIGTSRTGLRGYNRAWLRVVNRAAALTELVDMLDRDIGQLLGARLPPTALTLTNGWAATSAFYTLNAGLVWVHVENLTKGTPDTTAFFTLPAGARPLAARSFPAASTSTANGVVVRVAANGLVSMPASPVTAVYASFVFQQEQ